MSKASVSYDFINTFYASTLFFKFYENINLSSAQFSCSVVCDSLRSHGLQHTRLPCSSPTPRGFTDSCPLSRWCHPTISSSVVPFSSRLQTFPELVFSNESVLRIRWPNYWSFSFSISLSMNSQDWFPLEWTHWISLQSKGLWRVFSNTTVQKQQLFGTQPVLYSNSHIHTWLLEKPYETIALPELCWQINVPAFQSAV